jgi:hypothetical protein
MPILATIKRNFMRKSLAALIDSCLFVAGFAQSNKKFATYLAVQYNHTLSDLAKGNNPNGFGLGLQTVLHTQTIFRPTLEPTGDLYLYDDKVFRTDAANRPLPTVSGMVNLFVGSFVKLSDNIFSLLLVAQVLLVAKHYWASSHR